MLQRCGGCSLCRAVLRFLSRYGRNRDALESVSLIRGDALTIPLADNTVDLIVTSPPYFALRSYTDACGTCGGIAHVADQRR